MLRDAAQFHMNKNHPSALAATVLKCERLDEEASCWDSTPKNAGCLKLPPGVIQTTLVKRRFTSAGKHTGCV